MKLLKTIIITFIIVILLIFLLKEFKSKQKKPNYYKISNPEIFYK